MKRNITVEGENYQLTYNDPVKRCEGNPILTSHQVNKVWTRPEHQVITVHNAAVAKYDGKYVMLFRSHLRNGISVIGKATSINGVSNWDISPTPFIKPCKEYDSDTKDITQSIEDEAGGVEDPRISKINDTYYITYSAYHGRIRDRVRVSLATTKDFESISRHGRILDIDMRNVVIFPEKTDDKYYGLFRPNDINSDAIGGIFQEIRLGNCTSLEKGDWNIFEKPIMAVSGGPSSFGSKIGPGAPPMKTKYGWLNIFHGVRTTMDGNPYVLGIALHDLKDPSKVKVCNIPILFPTASDCKVSISDYVHVPNVVFCCGAIRNSNGSIYIYFGGNDTVMNIAFTHEDILVGMCNEYPQNNLTGEPIYEIR